MVSFGGDPFMGDGFFWPPWWFLLVAGFIILMIVIVIVKGISQWMINNASPFETVPATVVGKRTSTSGGHNSSVTTHYYITFELENKERKEFAVTGTEYGLLVEHDAGMLSFQGTRFKGLQRRNM